MNAGSLPESVVNTLSCEHILMVDTGCGDVTLSSGIAGWVLQAPTLSTLLCIYNLTSECDVTLWNR